MINLLASQWGELMTNVGDFDGRNTWGAREAGGDGEYLVRVGTENRQHVLGHISLLGYRGPIIAPMTTGGPDESALGDPVDILLTEWARQCRSQGGLVVVPHFPNPRAEHAAAIVTGDVDAIEMTSWENHYNGIDPYSLSDWYRYLNCGYLVPAVGGTDKMAAATAVGTVRTYARIDPRSEFSYESWMEAVRRGETFVTYGPLLEFTVDGQPMGSRIAMTAQGGTVDVAWQAASVTVPMTRVELVVNGEIRESVAVAPGAASGHWSVRVDRSAWLALLVRGHQPGKPELIASHGTPVMVTVEGARCWPPRTRSPSSTRSKAPSLTWTPWAPAPRIGFTSGCGWRWNPPIAPCTTGCTSRGTTTSTRRCRRASMRGGTGSDRLWDDSEMSGASRRHLFPQGWAAEPVYRQRF